eukprot:4094663-Amphidinium_carterae.1
MLSRRGYAKARAQGSQIRAEMMVQHGPGGRNIVASFKKLGDGNDGWERSSITASEAQQRVVARTQRSMR